MCGVPASRLKVKVFVQDREGLKRLFQQVDLVVMPSRTEGFGLTGLEAMSVGLSVLVSRDFGFGEALSSVAFGSAFVIKSEDPQCGPQPSRRSGPRTGNVDLRKRCPCAIIMAGNTTGPNSICD